MKQNRKKNIKKTAAVQNSKNVKAKKPFVVNKKRLIICLAAMVLLVATFFGVLIGVNVYRNSGDGIRDIAILKSKNFTLTVPMFSYYVRTVGAEKELYLDQTNVLLEKMVIYEEAVEKNTLFEEQVKEQVEQKLQLIAYDAEKEQMDMDEYLSLTYGRGVKLDDIRQLEEMLTVSRLMTESIYKDVVADPDKLSEYCKENTDDFLYCDYLALLVQVPTTEKMTEAEKKALISEYEGYANEMAACTTEKELIQKYTKYLNKIQAANEDEELTEEEVSGIIDRSRYTQCYNEVNSSDFEIDRWLFSTDRTVGDAKLNKDGTLDNTTFGVYYVTRPLYTNDSPTYSLYDILVSFSIYTETAAEANVKRVEEAYRKDATEKTLLSLASQYMGGFSENYILGDYTAAELKTWLEGERKQGDVLTYKDSDGWHFVCYKEEGLPECYAQAKQILENKEWTTIMEGYAKKHVVSMDTAGFNDVPDLSYGLLIFG